MQERERELSRIELNLERRELQLEEKKMILEIAIRVNDLRSALALIVMNGENVCDNFRDETKQLSLSASREASQDERDSGNGTSCSSGSGNEVDKTIDPLFLY